MTKLNEKCSPVVTIVSHALNLQPRFCLFLTWQNHQQTELERSQSGQAGFDDIFEIKTESVETLRQI